MTDIAEATGRALLEAEAMCSAIGFRLMVWKSLSSKDNIKWVARAKFWEAGLTDFGYHYGDTALEALTKLMEHMKAHPSYGGLAQYMAEHPDRLPRKRVDRL